MIYEENYRAHLQNPFASTPICFNELPKGHEDVQRVEKEKLCFYCGAKSEDLQCEECYQAEEKRHEEREVGGGNYER